MKKKLTATILAATLMLAGPYCVPAHAADSIKSDPRSLRCLLMPWLCK